MEAGRVLMSCFVVIEVQEVLKVCDTRPLLVRNVLTTYLLC